MENILQFLYTGQVRLKTTEVQGFLKIADKLEISLAEDSEGPNLKNDQSKKMNVSDEEGVKEDPLKVEKTYDENKEDDTSENKSYILENQQPDPESDHVDLQMPLNELSKKKIPLDECDFKKFKNLTDFINSLFTKIGNKACCNICGKESSRPQIYKAHAESHIQGLKFPCKNCDFICGARRNLQNHLKMCPVLKKIDTTSLTNLLDNSSASGNAGCWKCLTRIWQQYSINVLWANSHQR